MNDQRVGVVDVDLGLKKGHTELGERMSTGRQLDGNELVLRERVLVQGEDLPALLGMAKNQPHNRTIRRVGDGQSNDLDLAALEGADDFEELPNPVLQKDRELGHSWPVAAMQCLQFDFAATV